MRSKQGTAILDALELLDGETLKPRNSRYAKQVLDALSLKGQGQVLNRSELVAPEAGVDYWMKFSIEPEFLSVVLAALVHSGDIVLSLAGKRVDAAGIDQFAKVGISERPRFQAYRSPTGYCLSGLCKISVIYWTFPRGLIVNPANRDDGAAKIQQRVGELLSRTGGRSGAYSGASLLGVVPSSLSKSRRTGKTELGQPQGIPGILCNHSIHPAS